VRGGRRVPRQSVAGLLGTCPGVLERRRVVEQLTGSRGKRLDVTGRHDASRAEPRDRLRDSADVVRHCRHSGAERLQERAALVELRPVWKECDGCLAERALELVLREVTEAPLREVAGLRPVAVHGFDRIARNEQARPGNLLCRRDRVSDPFIRADRAKTEQRAPVVGALRVAGEDRMWDDGCSDAELGEAFPAALAVNDDAVEAGEKVSPEPLLSRRPPWQKIVCREDRRHPRPQQQSVQLRRREPLHVQNIRAAKEQGRGARKVLHDLDRDAQPGAPEDPRREGVEGLAAPVAVRGRRVAEAEPRGDELDLDRAAGERSRELVVVGRREGRRVRDDDSHRSTVERLLVRTWNLFHGNSQPPGRRAFLKEMVRLASADRPAVLCLQEVPAWALGLLDDWSGMPAIGAVAERPSLGPLPSTAELGRALTELHHGLLRSAFTGQANAILLGSELQVREHRHVILNPFRFRRAQARRLGLGIVERLAWGKERRVCHAVRVQRGHRTLLIGDLHATGFHDKRVPDAELLRAAVFVDGMARPGEPVLLCGDFNLSVNNSLTLADLTTAEWGFSGPTPVGVDHVLVRGLDASPPLRWPGERREYEGRLLSDHAPVEREVA
jgi:endonuclease/exonuclease/phosphatase family metal-dependent hydrolase